jgi:hypothetical protein
MRSFLAHGLLVFGMFDRNKVDRGKQARAELSAILVRSRGLAMPSCHLSAASRKVLEPKSSGA